MIHTTGIISSPFPITALTPTEEWAYRSPRRGDHIRVDRGMYNHHGIYVADDEVIHFSSEDDDNILGSDNQVLRTNLKGFLRDAQLEVKVYTAEEIEDLFPVEDIVNWAQACIGDEGYHLVFNNCEHFANYCTLGRHHSHQVSRVIGGQQMSLWGTVSGFIGSLFGGGSSRDSTTTTYEPDKVRVAEIEASSKIKLEEMKQERIRLYAETQMELSEFNAKMEAAVIEARVRGEQVLQQSMVELMREANVLAEQRLKLIETASMDAIRQIDGYYDKLISDLGQQDFENTKQRMPQLLEILKNFEAGTPEHELYYDEIKQYKSRHSEFIMNQMKSIQSRQTQVLVSCIASKEQINSHISLLVEKRMDQLKLNMDSQLNLQLAGAPSQQQIAQQLQITDENTDASA